MLKLFFQVIGYTMENSHTIVEVLICERYSFESMSKNVFITAMGRVLSIYRETFVV
jgi:hypothetical protein